MKIDQLIQELNGRAHTEQINCTWPTSFLNRRKAD